MLEVGSSREERLIQALVNFLTDSFEVHKKILIANMICSTFRILTSGLWRSFNIGKRAFAAK